MLNIHREFPSLLDLRPGMDPAECDYDFANCFTLCNPGASISREDLAAALIITGASYADISGLLKRSRTEISRAVASDPELYAIADEARDTMLDVVESWQYKAAMAGDLTTGRFLLTTVGKDRGYITRNETTGKNGQPVLPSLSPETISKMPEDVKRQLLEAMDNQE